MVTLKWSKARKGQESWQLKQCKEKFPIPENIDNTGSQLFWSLNHYLKGNAELQVY